MKHDLNIKTPKDGTHSVGEALPGHVQGCPKDSVGGKELLGGGERIYEAMIIPLFGKKERANIFLRDVREIHKSITTTR